MKEKNTIQLINALPFAWLFSGYLLVSNGQTYMAYFLIFATIVNIITSKANPKNKDKSHIIIAVIVYSIALTANYIYTSDFWPVIRSSLYFIPFAITTPISRKTIEKTLLILPITAIALSYQYWNNGDSRYLDSTGLNPIPLATVMALYLSFSIMKLIKPNKEKWVKLCFFITTPLLTYTILKTETRGVWLIVVCYLLLLSIYFLKILSRRVSFKIIILLLLFPSIYISHAYYEVVSERISNTQQEIKKISSGDYGTSIGVRLELWITSMQILREKCFILPSNEVEINSYFQKKYEDGQITGITLNHSSNAHNQYLNSWLRGGLLGLVATLLLIFYPTWKAVEKYGYKQCILPIMITGVVFVCGLTELPLTQISAYQAFLMSMLASLIMLEKTK